MDGKISDEIRQLRDVCCADCVDKGCCDEMRALADRIDRELVELPKDADGVPIHVGDTVYMDDGRMAEVYSIKFRNGETNVLCRTSSGYSGYVYRLPNKLTHTRPDSWESIADELVEWCNSVDVDGDACDTPRVLAERIRKLAEKEGER